MPLSFTPIMSALTEPIRTGSLKTQQLGEPVRAHEVATALEGIA